MDAPKVAKQTTMLFDMCYAVSSRLLSITLCLVQRFILMCVLTEQLYVRSDSVTQTD